MVGYRVYLGKPAQISFLLEYCKAVGACAVLPISVVIAIPGV